MVTSNEIMERHAAKQIDEGLRQYMIRVFNYMGLGLIVTAVAAYFAMTPAFMQMMYNYNETTQTVSVSGLGWLISLAPLALIFGFQYALRKSTPMVAQSLFWAFSALMGLSVGSQMIFYTQESVARVFLISAATFLGMSLVGYTTKKDLTSIGSFLIMGVWGLFIASIINIFLQSEGLYYAVSYITVLVFTGLTAYDVQNIKNYYYMSRQDEFHQRSAILGAMSLYLDFINIFLALLRIMGDRR